MKNTYKDTAVRCVLFQEKGTWYGAALEFNLVVDGDSEAQVFDLLNQAVKSYFTTAKKDKVDAAVLNQKADAEYERMWKSASRPASRHTHRRRTGAYGSIVLHPAMA